MQNRGQDKDEVIETVPQVSASTEALENLGHNCVSHSGFIS